MPNDRPFSAFHDDPDGWREYWTLDQALESHRRYQTWLASQCPEPEPEPEPTQEEPWFDREDWATDSEYNRYLLSQTLVV